MPNKSPAKRRRRQPLGLTDVTPEEIERLSDANDEIIAVKAPGAAIASLPLAGPLRNPGFETVPWQARPEVTTTGLGQYTPSHLHVYTEVEMTEEHYPHASRDKHGALDKFCWACGRPVKGNGLSAKGHKGSGKPCPACGFKRKKELSQKQQNALKLGQDLGAQAAAMGPLGHRDLAVRTKEIATKAGPAALRAEEVQLKRGRDAGYNLTDLMRIQANDRAERILRPYFESLELEPKDDWSPSTKLEFYNGQTAIAEKLLNRLEGLPIARHRHVDKDDEDIIPEGELSPKVVAKLVSSILAGQEPEELVADAEFEEITEDATGTAEAA